MYTSRVRTARPGPASVLGPAIVFLLASCILAPASAGELNGFFKKGGKDSGRPSNSSPDPGSSADRQRPPSSDSNSDDRSEPSGKHRREESGNSKKSGGVFDLFGKQSKPQPPATEGTRPGDSQTSGSRPERAGSNAGGVFDFFRKPGRPQPVPTTSVSPVPTVVVYHYCDPWYYPYDGLFFRYYSPYALSIWEYRYGGWPYSYGRPDPDEIAEEEASDALRDIERGWRDGRYSLIERHVDRDGTIAVYNDGKYSHAMTAREFRALTLQAFEDVKTIRFRFFETRMVHRDEAVAEGEHLFKGPDGEERTVRVEYTLRKSGRRWIIRSMDLQQEHRFSSLSPAVPERDMPFLSLASLDNDVSLDESVSLARADSGPVWEAAWATPAPSGPQVTLDAGAAEVLTDECGITLTRLAAADPAPAVPAKPGAARAAPESSLRVVCESSAVRLASLHAAKKPVKVATVTCVVLKAGRGMGLVPGSRLTCDVSLQALKDGLTWQVLHHGEARHLEKGTIPAAKLKPAAAGHLRVVVDRVSTPMAGGKGEQHQTLFSKRLWDYQIAVVASPQKPSRQPGRTELLISRKGS